MSLVVTLDYPSAKAVKHGRNNNLSILSGSIAFDSSYPTGGEAMTDISSHFKKLHCVFFEDSGGYIFQYIPSTDKVKVFQPTSATDFSLATEAAHTHAVALDGGATGAEAAHTHAVALDTGTSAAGASHNHAFTGTSAGALDLTNTAFAGTGLTAAGQVMTTTDNHTMTLNQCAGMWLIPATGATPPMLVLSNTAVTGAPAVLTCQGACSTDAGTYKIVKNIVPVGTNAAEATHTHGPGTLADAASAAGSSHTHSYGTLADAASGVGSAHTHTMTYTAGGAAEVGSTESLAALTAVIFLAVGET